MKKKERRKIKRKKKETIRQMNQIAEYSKIEIKKKDIGQKQN